MKTDLQFATLLTITLMIWVWRYQQNQKSQTRSIITRILEADTTPKKWLEWRREASYWFSEDRPANRKWREQWRRD